MLRLDAYRSLYVAFDRYPSSKGAATHIEQAAGALARAAPPCLLLVLGDTSLPEFERGNTGSPDILRFREPIPNFLHRTTAFSNEVADIVDELADSLRICHFRDPWGGLPVCAQEEQSFRTVYEVNGLPSIELPYHYPNVLDRTLERIAKAEAICLEKADQVITPSATIKANLIQLGTQADKIDVVPNGATIYPPAARPASAPDRYILYFGAVQPWQGVPALLRAFARLTDLQNTHLVICSSVKRRATTHLRRLARRLAIADRMHWEHQLPRQRLQSWLQHADVTVAPLTECSRNLAQGCCPLKVLESMAAGVPVVASDLPAVREIIKNGTTGRLVPAGRPELLALALRHLLECPETAQALGRTGRQHIESHLTWERALDSQTDLYKTLLKS